MILNKYNRGKTSETTTYATSSTTSSTYGSNMDTDNIINGSGELDRWLWGVQDDGEDIDDTMFVGGSIYVQKDSQIGDHENDDGNDDDWEPVYEPYPDDDGGNIYADGEIQAPYLYATDILYVPHPDTKEKTDIMELIHDYKFYYETDTAAFIDANHILLEGGSDGVAVQTSGTGSNSKFTYNGCEVATQCWVEGYFDMSQYYTKEEIDEGFEKKLYHYEETENAAIVDANYVLLAGGNEGVAVQTDNSQFTYNGCEVATKCDLEEIPHTWFGNASITAHTTIDRNNVFPESGTVKVGDAIFSMHTSGSTHQLVIAVIEAVDGDNITANAQFSLTL